MNAAELALLPKPDEVVAGREPAVPWGAFFGSGSMWLLSLQYLCISYGFWFYVTWLLMYIREAFHMKDADRYLAASLAGLPLFMAGISVFTGKSRHGSSRASAAPPRCGACWARSAAASPD